MKSKSFLLPILTLGTLLLCGLIITSCSAFFSDSKSGLIPVNFVFEDGIPTSSRNASVFEGNITATVTLKNLSTGTEQIVTSPLTQNGLSITLEAPVGDTVQVILILAPQSSNTNTIYEGKSDTFVVKTGINDITLAVKELTTYPVTINFENLPSMDMDCAISKVEYSYTYFDLYTTTETIEAESQGADTSDGASSSTTADGTTEVEQTTLSANVSLPAGAYTFSAKVYYKIATPEITEGDGTTTSADNNTQNTEQTYEYYKYYIDETTITIKDVAEQAINIGFADTTSNTTATNLVQLNKCIATSISISNLDFDESLIEKLDNKVSLYYLNNGSTQSTAVCFYAKETDTLESLNLPELKDCFGNTVNSWLYDKQETVETELLVTKATLSPTTEFKDIANENTDMGGLSLNITPNTATVSVSFNNINTTFNNESITKFGVTITNNDKTYTEEISCSPTTNENTTSQNFSFSLQSGEYTISPKVYYKSSYDGENYSYYDFFGYYYDETNYKIDSLQTTQQYVLDFYNTVQSDNDTTKVLKKATEVTLNCNKGWYFTDEQIENMPNKYSYIDTDTETLRYQSTVLYVKQEDTFNSLGIPTPTSENENPGDFPGWTFSGCAFGSGESYKGDEQSLTTKFGEDSAIVTCK